MEERYFPNVKGLKITDMMRTIRTICVGVVFFLQCTTGSYNSPKKGNSILLASGSESGDGGFL